MFAFYLEPLTVLETTPLTKHKIFVSQPKIETDELRGGVGATVILCWLQVSVSFLKDY